MNLNIQGYYPITCSKLEQCMTYELSNKELHKSCDLPFSNTESDFTKVFNVGPGSYSITRTKDSWLAPNNIVVPDRSSIVKLGNSSIINPVLVLTSSRAVASKPFAVLAFNNDMSSESMQHAASIMMFTAGFNKKAQELMRKK
jgi:hypothetical protein